MEVSIACWRWQKEAPFCVRYSWRMRATLKNNSPPENRVHPEPVRLQQATYQGVSIELLQTIPMGLATEKEIPHSSSEASKQQVSLFVLCWIFLRPAKLDFIKAVQIIRRPSHTFPAPHYFMAWGRELPASADQQCRPNASVAGHALALTMHEKEPNWTAEAALPVTLCKIECGCMGDEHPGGLHVLRF